jgi:hypothetical protein
VEELKGQWVGHNAVVLRLGQPDSVEVRIALSGTGAGYVRAGQTVLLLPESDLMAQLHGRLEQVAAAADTSHTVEARLWLPATQAWRPGVTGQASIRLAESNLWGALWWRLRQQIRTDILL